MAANGLPGHASTTYLQQQILDESPVARVARLYEMTGLQLARTRAALAAGDVAAKGMAVHRTLRCLGVLQGCLDVKAGGDVAANLDRLYEYWKRRISQAHLNNDDAAFGEVATHVGQLASAWREVASRAVVPIPEPAAASAGAAALAR